MTQAKLIKEFRRCLTWARQDAGMTQIALARATGLKPSAINHFEMGRRLPSAMNLLRLGRALGKSCDYLLGRSCS